MIAITGASGQLGRLVLDQLLQTTAANYIVALARKPEALAAYADQGVMVRFADYDDPATLPAALEGVEKLLLISGSEVGKRAPQHQAVIDAAAQVGVSLLAYTSILHADRSSLMLAQEHRATEAALQSSSVPSVLLRNGWYSENYTGTAAMTIDQGALYGCAGEGRIASASRADFAAAAVAVLTSDQPQAGNVYELSGDAAFSLSEYAAELARQSGKAVVYNNLSQDDYQALLLKVGLPEGLAVMLADSEGGAAQGDLFGDSGDLSHLIGRATTPIEESIRDALKA
ncbi:NAD(P)-dependent oxidoreductase [Saccharospirillum sp. MSK14-1]|uniref:SDR family oxidoreductase n=1 Tax=Saccharospirillum sp. MSK14-1 TaxID=1897632 RepID=UPI000D336C30|nr:SDR family oxidoreductase [Saccharospirillum sp. MSK14-1]PTY38505.1 NAD(P)-dependent oxidoreductase [Saccharospirillum sp. MSK14-1]